VVPKGSIRLEVSEQVALENPEQSTEVLEWLRSAGAEIVLDEFGTGYSSLAYLDRLPFDTIKIDQSVMQAGNVKGGNDSLLMRSMVALAHELGKKVVAKGVEGATEVSFLRSIECEYAQGPYCGDAIAEGEVAQVLAAVRSSESKHKPVGVFRPKTKKRRTGKPQGAPHKPEETAAQTVAAAQQAANSPPPSPPQKAANGANGSNGASYTNGASQPPPANNGAARPSANAPPPPPQASRPREDNAAAARRGRLRNGGAPDAANLPPPPPGPPPMVPIHPIPQAAAPPAFQPQTTPTPPQLMTRLADVLPDVVPTISADAVQRHASPGRALPGGPHAQNGGHSQGGPQRGGPAPEFPPPLRSAEPQPPLSPPPLPSGGAMQGRMPPHSSDLPPTRPILVQPAPPPVPGTNHAGSPPAGFPPAGPPPMPAGAAPPAQRPPAAAPAASSRPAAPPRAQPDFSNLPPAIAESLARLAGSSRKP
jgi:hypothetical protein